jgi:hypothetical protein
MTQNASKGSAMSKCLWCADPQTDAEPMDPERELCRSHLAEYEGLSVAELDRMESEQYADMQ